MKEAKLMNQMSSDRSVSIPKVVVRYLENGLIDFLVHGDQVLLFVVDERVPDDRVFEVTRRCSDEAIQEIVGDSPVGNDTDERHKALKARLFRLFGGKLREV